MVDLTAEDPDTPAYLGGGGELAAAAAQAQSAHALVLRFERDRLIRDAAEQAVGKLYKAGRSRARLYDFGAFHTGRDDAGKLSTGRALA